MATAASTSNRQEYVSGRIAYEGDRPRSRLVTRYSTSWGPYDPRRPLNLTRLAAVVVVVVLVAAYLRAGGSTYGDMRLARWGRQSTAAVSYRKHVYSDFPELPPGPWTQQCSAKNSRKLTNNGKNPAVFEW